MRTIDGENALVVALASRDTTLEVSVAHSGIITWTVVKNDGSVHRFKVTVEEA